MIIDLKFLTINCQNCHACWLLKSCEIMYLIYRLAATKDKINSTLNCTTIKVVTALIIPQRVLHAGEAAPIERRLVSGHHGGHRRHPWVLIVTTWTVV